MRNNQSYSGAVALTILSSACVAAIAIFGKYLTPLVSEPMLIFVRLVLPACILWGIIFIFRMPKRFDGSQKLLVLRSLFSMLTQTCFLVYLFYGTAFNATLLLMTSPLFMPLIAHIFDKQPIKRSQSISLVITFVGIALILKPTTGVFQWVALVGLASGICHAFAQWTYHKMTHHSSPLLITTHMYTYGSLFAAIPLIIFMLYAKSFGVHPGTTLNTNGLSITLFFLLLAIAAIGAQLLRGAAFKKVNKAHTLTPFLYTAVVFTGLYDALFFNAMPHTLSIIGAVLVFIGLNTLVIARFLSIRISH